MTGIPPYIAVEKLNGVYPGYTHDINNGHKAEVADTFDAEADRLEANWKDQIGNCDMSSDDMHETHPPDCDDEPQRGTDEYEEARQDYQGEIERERRAGN